MKKLGFYALAAIVMAMALLVTVGVGVFSHELRHYEGFVHFAGATAAIVTPFVVITLAMFYGLKLCDKADRI